MHGVVRELRAVKSPAEVGKIATACRVAGESFAAVPGRLAAAQRLEEAAEAHAQPQLQDLLEHVAHEPLGAQQLAADDVVGVVTAADISDNVAAKSHLMSRDRTLTVNRSVGSNASWS